MYLFYKNKAKERQWQQTCIAITFILGFTKFIDK